MYCNKCGTELPVDSAFCQKCGQRQNGGSAEQVYDFKSSNASSAEPNKGDKGFWSSWSSGRRAWFVVVMVLIALAGLNGQNIFTYVTGLATGQVYLDSGRVESTIETGVYDQVGETVTASCPNPLAGRVGETRQCTVVDSLGATYFVDITVQSTNGDITWKVQN